MTWKPRVVIAGAIVVVSMILSAVGVNTFIQSIGLLAAGWLFGTAQNIAKTNKGG